MAAAVDLAWPPCVSMAVVQLRVRSLSVPFTIIAQGLTQAAGRAHPGAARRHRGDRHAGRQPPSQPAAAERHRRDPRGRAGDRRRASNICWRPPRSNPNLNPEAAATTSSARRAVPVHRADLARHDEGVGRGARLRPICRRDRAGRRPGAIEVSDPAMRSEIMELRNDPTANAAMAGAFTQQQCRHALKRAARPRADRRRTLYRAFPRGRRRRPADQAGRAKTRTRSRPTLFPAPRAPTARSSTTSRAGRAASPRSMPRWSAAIEAARANVGARRRRPRSLTPARSPAQRDARR